MLSVICPVYNEEKYIVSCIESILQQDYPRNDMEVLFVDGMSTDRTREIIETYLLKYSFLRVLDNPEKIVPCAMNKGIVESRGEVIVRIDAHTLYAKNYFSVLVKQLGQLQADNVGAVCRTNVLNKNVKTLAIREVLSNKFGVGNSVFRTGIDRIMEVDTVPFGCWRREVFDKYGYYDTRLVRNQDIELNKRIIRGGGKIYIVPDTYCTYLARETFEALAKNNYGNGKWNILTVFFTRQFDSLSVRHFVPLFFLLSLLLPLVGSLWWSSLVWLSVLSASLYLMIFGWVSFLIAFREKLNFIYLLACFITLHLSYGWGSLIGIFKLPFLK